MKKLILAVAPAILFTFPAFCQDVNGTFTGVITDATGAVAPNASVTARNTGTSAAFATHSDGEGVYWIRNIPVGVYDITVESPGFQKFETKAVRVQVDEIVRVDVKLNVGSTNETVTVTGAATVVDTTTATLKAVVDQ